MIRTLTAAFLALTVSVPPSTAGPFPSYLDTGVERTVVASWATHVGNYLPTAEITDSPQNDPSLALGPADGNTTSLGDLDADAIASGAAPGTITVGFAGRIVNGPGSDFAAFENAAAFFDDFDVNFMFAELAFVEVSSNGTDFARFRSTSLNIEFDPNTPDPDHDQLHVPFGRNFAGINTTNVNNLAGIHPELIGTGFDLDDLATDPLVSEGKVELNAIRYVRFVDIPGNGAVVDSHGNSILDTWKTEQTGGFDLDAVGAIHFVPEPGQLGLLLWALLGAGTTRQGRLIWDGLGRLRH